LIYAIVDIETTGGSHGNRITEIAVVKTDGSTILGEYETLVNPEIFIPKSISLLTGITNPMVEDAPRFGEIADELYEQLKDCVFVAHNVSFDYSIIKNHYEDIGKSLNFKKLCTVRLAKGIIPGHASYSLGKLCNALGIKNHSRHRAMGDAKVTAKLFNLLYKTDTNQFISYSLNQLNKEATIPPNLEKSEYDNLPSNPGVYYLMGENMDVLYVGKAKNIKQRITQHFTEKSRAKSELLRKIHHISYQETGNELIALLLESDEIKKHYPPYNKAQKNKSQNYHVCYYQGQDEILRVDVFLKKFATNSIHSFSSMVMAKDFLYQLVEKWSLCPKYTGLERTKNQCYLGSQCQICNERISKEEYNNLVLEATAMNQTTESLLILGNGRTQTEKSVVFLKEGDYHGFGFIDEEYAHSIDDVLASIKPFKNTNDITRILRGFLNQPIPKQYQIIELSEANS
jgi:DNA polymerase-3 subunit epsilon